jgi:hypothetical protein
MPYSAENQPIGLRDGMKVFDKHGDGWIYAGSRWTTAATEEHWFFKLGEFTSRDGPYTYKATFRRTIVKMFPSLGEYYE